MNWVPSSGFARAVAVTAELSSAGAVTGTVLVSDGAAWMKSPISLFSPYLEFGIVFGLLGVPISPVS